MGRLVRVVLFLCSATVCGTIAAGGGVVGGGRLTEWIPMYVPEITVTAAMGKNMNPVVVYNSVAFEQTPSFIVQFFVRRQDYVAFLAAQLLRNNRQLSLTWGDLAYPNGSTQRGLPFSPIPEEVVYDHPSLQGGGAVAIDCLAYMSMPSREQAAFRQLMSISVIEISPRRRLTAADIPNLEGPTCRKLAQKFLQ